VNERLVEEIDVTAIVDVSRQGWRCTPSVGYQEESGSGASPPKNMSWCSKTGEKEGRVERWSLVSEIQYQCVRGGKQRNES